LFDLVALVRKELTP